MGKDEAADRLRKLEKLLPIGMDLVEKLGALLQECNAVTGGKATIGQQLAVVMASFSEQWGIRYAGGQSNAYQWNRVRDVAQLKRLIKNLGVEELNGRIARYMRSDDAYTEKARHPFMLFVSQINSFAAPAAPAELTLEGDEPVIPDCRHTPPCRTDAEHTSRKIADMKRNG